MKPCVKTHISSPSLRAVVHKCMCGIIKHRPQTAVQLEKERVAAMVSNRRYLHLNPSCKYGRKRNRGWQNKKIEPHTQLFHTHGKDRNTPDGTQSALNQTGMQQKPDKFK